ncbi:MAG: M56 family metallopeptidase [Solirubrobacteraceae bacterium]
MRKSTRPRTVLLLALLLGTIGAAASVAPAGAAIASLHRAVAATGRLQVAGISFSYPRLNEAAWILLGLALIGAVATAIALRAVLRQHLAYRRFLSELQIVGRLGDRSGVYVITDPRPQAFCAGYLRPRVFISQPALDLLDDAELDAVLAHEQHHRRVRDPLRFACGYIFSQGLFFVPVLRPLFRRYADLAELDADGVAVRMGAGGQAALASALLRFEASGAGIAPARVDALLGRPLDWRRPWWLMAASIASLASLSSMTWVAGQAASARATLNLPFLSSQPCVVMLMLVSLLGYAVLFGRRTTARRVAVIGSRQAA